MNTKKNTIKSIICCTTAFSALTMAGIGAININKQSNEVYATNATSIPVTISNSNFNSSTKNNYPYNPSNFTAYNHDSKVDASNTDANITAGVINLSNEKYSTKFSLAKRNSLDDYVLMIDSSKEVDGKVTMHKAKYGFRTSSKTTLDANSKYMITVDVFTATNSNIASLYLFDTNGEVFSSIEKVNSYNTWTTYTFFVSTNNMSSVDVNVGMYLDGAGIVLFDNMSAFKLSDNDYTLSKNNSLAGSFKEIDQVDNIEKVFHINAQGQLENRTNSSEKISLTETKFETNKISNLTVKQDSDGENSRALLLKNTDKTYSEYETEDNFLEFEQNRIYKVSVNVKTNNLDGTAFIKLIRTDIPEGDKNYSEDHNKTIKITSNTVSDEKSVTNDYKTYSFLINSHPSKTVGYKFAFGLGENSDSTASGEMYISEIEISKLDYESYDSAKTGSDAEKINFVDAYSNSKIMLNNGDFNAFKIADHNQPMPATPIDWTVGLGKHNQYYGVVNTQTFSADLENSKFSNLRNPYTTPTNDNVLMMYNETADSLSYTSATKTLDSKSYHKFEVRVQTQNAPIKISLVTKKEDAEVELLSKTIDTNYQWQNVELFLHTAYQSLDVSLKLTLDTTSYGYAYVDDAKFDYLLTSTQLENEFNSAEASNTTAITDLTNILHSTSSDNFSQTTLFESAKVSGVESGIITLAGARLDEVIYDSNNLDNFKSVAGEQVFGIRSTNDVFHTAISNIGFKLTNSSSYYKISVSVYTQNLSTNDTSVDPSTLGASIKLTGFDNAFTSIQSNNEWSTYSFYIQAEDDKTTYLELSLGNEDVKAKGDVFFGNIEFLDNITEEEYNSAVESDIVKILKIESKKTEDETENDAEESNSSNINWLYLIPSLLTALAILIAVVGFALRKLKFKKPVKKTKNNYDRNKTVSIQYYTRKATTLREEKLRELNADLEKINAQRSQYEETYKQDLTKIRQLKIKRANPQEITKLEKDLKKNQKLSASIGITANKIAAELEYVKTDAYLNSLIKKLQREQAQQNSNEKDSNN